MEDDWPYTAAGPRLQHNKDLGTRRQKERTTKDEDWNEGAWKLWTEVQSVAADRADWKSSVEALCVT